MVSKAPRVSRTFLRPLIRYWIKGLNCKQTTMMVTSPTATDDLHLPELVANRH